MIESTDKLKDHTLISENKKMNYTFMNKLEEIKFNDDDYFPAIHTLEKSIEVIFEDLDFINKPLSTYEEKISAMLYDFFRMGYEERVAENDDKKYKKLNVNILRDSPSRLFLRYLKENEETDDYIVHAVLHSNKKLNDSKNMQRGSKINCYNLIRDMGGFTQALWNGDIERAIRVADGNHMEKLEKLISRLDKDSYETLLDEYKYYYNNAPVWLFEWYLNRIARDNQFDDGVIVKHNGQHADSYDIDCDYHLEPGWM